MLSIIRRIKPLEILKYAINNPTTKSLCLTTTQIDKLIIPTQHNLTFARFKSKSSNKKKDELSTTSGEESDEFQRMVQDKYTKVIDVNVNSLRVDAILKAGLGLARNKIDVLFYESKLRVNGKKILKKSSLVEEGDELDVVKGINPQNPNTIIVARVELLNVKEKGDTFNVKIRKCKSLIVDNYDDTAGETN